MTMNSPYLILVAFCDKVLNIGDVYVCEIFFPKTFTKGCAILIKCPISHYRGRVLNLISVCGESIWKA